MWYGNRGCLHNDRGEIVRPFRKDLDRWLICVLDFKGRRRPLLRPGHFTELFFLDEATGFAAGHRPCVECRRNDALRFIKVCGCASARELDARLALERKEPRRIELVEHLPDGAMFTTSEQPTVTLLKWRGALWRWSHFGYSPGPALPESAPVTVLTPALSCDAFSKGYTPHVHPSAGQMLP